MVRCVYFVGESHYFLGKIDNSVVWNHLTIKIYYLTFFCV